MFRGHTEISIHKKSEPVPAHDPVTGSLLPGFVIFVIFNFKFKQRKIFAKLYFLTLLFFTSLI